MATDKAATVIKKYANRRLYHTGTSTYVTLEDLAKMVREGEDFSVYDAQDRRGHHPFGPDADHLRAGEQGGPEPPAGHVPAPAHPLLRRQHAGARAELPRIVDRQSHREQEKLREQMAKAFGPSAFEAMEEQVRANMELFTEAMRMFSPFAAPASERPRRRRDGKESPPTGDSDLDHLKQQMAEMQKKLEALSRK